MSFYGSMEPSIKSRRKQDCFVGLNLMLHFQVYNLMVKKVDTYLLRRWMKT